MSTEAVGVKLTFCSDMNRFQNQTVSRAINLACSYTDSRRGHHDYNQPPKTTIHQPSFL